ncbi:FlgO family outer membrane protein [Flocculibacter collagenilyticus]|uniref:FlgO family outer membrane protein n=1 Tax=Flocculibacter collagenilyticus TaxID=2744479 RepID=UPI001EEABAD1|nr:FlgO family outer membrane protein [Flocculibacter collagenilyticus]
MKKLTLLLPAIILLSGCSTVERWIGADDSQPKRVIVQDKHDVDRYHDQANSVNVVGLQNPSTSSAANAKFQMTNQLNIPYKQNYQGNGDRIMAMAASGHNMRAPLNKNINHYVRGIMHRMVENLQFVNEKTPLGVTSFVFLDGDYQHASLLGNQISESFIHEIHKFGIPVIDFKTTNYIRVTPQGDFIFSRDFLELESELPIEYVVAGTLVKYQAGYLVNARIVGIDTKAVVASAQGFIPSYVANALFSTSAKDGVSLVQSEE